MIPASVRHLRPWFDNEIDRATLLRVAKSWLGTPFHERGRIKGVGVDCFTLPGLVLEESGHLPAFNPPRYSLGGGQSLDALGLVHWVEASGRFHRLEDVGHPVFGDVLVFLTQPLKWHCGLLLSWPIFIHTLQDREVQFAPLHDPTWSKRLVRIYRPIKA